MKVMKSYKLEESVIEMIQDVAKKEFGGNMTSALESMVNQAHCMRQINVDTRWAMYSAAKKQKDGFNDRDTRAIVDALHV